ncbi:unnamed protein product [Closterium sp. Naga37s-1]|nr:unnamed protein product [Closterium sp. Naga37s-1]
MGTCRNGYVLLLGISLFRYSYNVFFVIFFAFLIVSCLLLSQGIADEEIGGLENNWDLIVMMGCLPNLPKVDLPASTTVEDWGLPDPAAHPELMDSVIEKIVEKVKAI